LRAMTTERVARGLAAGRSPGGCCIRTVAVSITVAGTRIGGCYSDLVIL
jgi:hypothetical protein